MSEAKVRITGLYINGKEVPFDFCALTFTESKGRDRPPLL